MPILSVILGGFFSCAKIIVWSMSSFQHADNPDSEPWFKNGDPLNMDLTVNWSWFSDWAHSCCVLNILSQMMLMQLGLSAVQVSSVEMESGSVIDNECASLSG